MNENKTEMEAVETVETNEAANKIVKENGGFRDWIKLADGTVLECGAGHDDDRTLWIWIDHNSAASDLQTAFTTFTDPSKTSHIEKYYRDNMTHSWDGYTRVFAIRQRDNGDLDIGLRRPE